MTKSSKKQSAELQGFLTALINCSLTAERKKYWLQKVTAEDFNEQDFQSLQTEVQESLHHLSAEIAANEATLSDQKQDLFALEHNVLTHIHQGVKEMNEECKQRLSDFKTKAAKIEFNLDQKIEQKSQSKTQGVITKLKNHFRK